MRFTIFTLLYLAAGICLTVVAFQQPDLASSFKPLLFTNAALLYLFAVLSTFRFWQGRFNRDRPGNPSTPVKNLYSWLVIAAALFSVFFEVLTHQPMTTAIRTVVVWLPIVLLHIELIFRTQTQLQA